MMNKVDILTDISTLTAVSRLSLENLCAKANLAISHGVLEATHKLDNQIECNIGIGLLYIKIEESAIKYKFIPSRDLEDKLATTLKEKESPLILTADKILGQRIENAYRSLL